MVESALMFPFILLGKVMATLGPKAEYDIYFFFPFYHIGGAEKIHYQIAQAFAGSRCIVYFTRKSKGENFLKEFEQNGFTIRDISKYTDNKLLYPVNFIFRGLISFQINNQRNVPIVFNGQSNFGYKISPWVKEHIPQVDLIHALCSFSAIRIPFLEFYKRSVTVSQEIIDKHKRLYDRFRMPRRIRDNIVYINYGIELPVRIQKTQFVSNLRVLYVGRGSEEKRVHLIAQMARVASEQSFPFTFQFLGDVDKFIPDQLKGFCHLLGSVTDPNDVDRIYRQSDVLVVASSTESGPLVVLEAMARGLAILSTPVGIVNEHIKHGINGFVFSSIEHSEQIVQEGIQFLLSLSRDIDLQKRIATENQNYAFENFGIEHFYKNYRNLFKQLNQSV